MLAIGLGDLKINISIRTLLDDIIGNYINHNYGQRKLYQNFQSDLEIRRYQRDNYNPYIEVKQTTQWGKEKRQTTVYKTYS